jgi:hypothetical protein
MIFMRTTVTLDHDVQALLKKVMKERGISFKEAINTAIRAGLARIPGRARSFRQKTFKMGQPAVPLQKALQLAAELEDEENVRQLALRK